jgi:hypothetical protein
MNNRFLSRIAIIILVLGALSIGLAQQITTITTTTVITYPPSTATETSVVPGTTGVATIAHGGYRLIYIEMRPDQECIMIVRGEPVTEVTIPGATIPGITTTYVIPAATYETTITQVEGGTTETRTGLEDIEVLTTIEMEPISTVISMPVLVYGEIMEYCEAITITMINRFEANEPMTIYIEMPGYTMDETVMTLPEPLITGPLTTTKTTIIPGETYTMTHEEKGQTIVTTISNPDMTVIRTVTIPGSTVTETITIVSTMSGTPETKTETSTITPQTKASYETTSPTTTQATTVIIGLEIPSLEFIIPAVIVIMVIIVVILITRRVKK